MTLQVESATIGQFAFGRVYAEVQQFYARQMQFLDTGAAENWAETFTEDGWFAPPSLPEPVRGRANLAAGARSASDELIKAGKVHRHWLGMVVIDPQPDGSLHVRSYAQIYAIPRDGHPQLHLTCVCDDILVRVNGELKVSGRRVTRDDRP